jgi:predicted nucleic acid-binding protein
MTEAWSIMLDQHVYEADALQVATYMYSGGDALLSGDEGLVRVSRKLGLKAFEIVSEGEELKRFIETSLEMTDS